MPHKTGAAKRESAAKLAAAKLRVKQQAFVDAYLSNGWNATRAAKTAGYSARSARSIGSENLTKPNIRALIDARLAQMGMGADEVLARLADMAASSMADFITVKKVGHTAVAVLDLDKAAEADKLHLIKKFKVGVEGVSIELYDAQAALETIGRHHKLFVDRTEHTGAGGGPIEVKDLETVRQKRWQAAAAAVGAAAQDTEGPEGG